MPELDIRPSASRDDDVRRIEAVERVLAGESPPEVLGYPLGRRHLAVVAWGRNPPESVKLLAWELSSELLSVQVEQDTVWGWLALSNGVERELHRWLRGFTPPAGGVALGATGAGPNGFRESHMQALAAERVARISGAAVTFYADVALEALALHDIDAARHFVRHVLGDLLEENLRARELRATLRAYFAAGQQALSAAAMLGVHERTVGHRLRAVETRLGDRPVASARAELELALRLHELLS